MTQALRSELDVALSLDRQAKHTGEGAYRSVLSWKGAVFAQQREVQVFRRAIQRAGGQPEVIQMFDDLQGTARRLATLALAVPPDPKQQPAWSAMSPRRPSGRNTWKSSWRGAVPSSAARRVAGR